MKEWVCFIEMDEKSSIGYYNGVPAVKVGTEIQLVEDGFSLYIPSETESQQWDRSDRRPYYIHPRRYHVRDGNWYDGKWVMPRGCILNQHEGNPCTICKFRWNEPLPGRDFFGKSLP